MDKPKLNFVIDAVMFVLLSAIAGMGLLMNYVLLPGREAWVKYGRRVELTLFGLDRHQWGDLHFYLALIFLSCLTLHLILHWQMLAALFKRLVTTPKARTIALWIFLLACLLLVYFPFLLSPRVEEAGRGRGWHQSAMYPGTPVSPPGLFGQ